MVCQGFGVTIASMDQEKDTVLMNIFGHVETIEGPVSKGQSIGEIIEEAFHWKLAYQVFVYFRGQEYMFTPTLFEHDPPFPWPCVPDSWYDCEPEPFDYPSP